MRICDIHKTEMILGGYPNKYYFCTKCREDHKISQSEKYNKAISISQQKIGDDGVDALLDIINLKLGTENCV